MSLLYLTFLFPLLGWLLLAFSIGRLGERSAALIGVGSIGLSALTTIWVGFDFLNHTPEGGVSCMLRSPPAMRSASPLACARGRWTLPIR